MLHSHTRYGFTLIELLVVVSIISILAVIAIPNMGEAQIRAKVAATKSNLRTVSIKAEMHFVDFGEYPPFGTWRWFFIHDEAFSDAPNSTSSASTFHNKYKALYGPHQDPFEWTALKQAGIHDAKWLPRYNGQYIMHGFHYFRFATLFYATRELTWQGDPNAAIWGDVERLAGPWIMFSPGPDLIAETPAWFTRNGEVIFEKFNEQYLDRQYFVSYDPTNGTVSYGNIFRTPHNSQGLADDIRFHETVRR